jgi:hypothetical protein
MKRPAPRTNNTRFATHNPSANHCRAIVLVEDAGIRKKIKKDYEKALRDLDNARRQLDQFHQTDLPQFTRWLNTHFGVFLTELRELSQKLAVDEELISHVQHEVMFGGVSYPRAYQRVTEFRENPDPPPTGTDESDRYQGPFEGRQDSRSFDGEEDPIDAFFNQLFGESEPGERPQGKKGSRLGHQSQSASPPHASLRLKELYRTLVRRLHPDTQREMTAQKTEWWHQAQAAYEAGDVEQLEVILTLCEIGDSGTTAHTSASLLQRITTQLKGSLREIKRQITGRRKDPAWGFSRCSNHDTLFIQMRRSLLGDLHELRDRWRQTQENIARWKTAAERLKRGKRRNRTQD